MCGRTKLATIDQSRSPLCAKWSDALERLTFALQPIAHIHTGETYGFEALLRGWREAGFDSINHVFDAAYAEGQLLWLNRELRKKAVELFETLGFTRQLKLFFNVDNRIFAVEDDKALGEMVFPELAADARRSPWFCVELSERHELRADEATLKRLRRFQDRLSNPETADRPLPPVGHFRGGSGPC